MRVSRKKFFSMLEKGKVSNFTINGVKYYADRIEIEEMKGEIKDISKNLIREVHNIDSILIKKLVMQYKELIDKNVKNTLILPEDLRKQLIKLNKKELEGLLNAIGLELFIELQAKGKRYDKWFANLDEQERNLMNRELKAIDSAKNDRIRLTNLIEQWKKKLNSELKSIYNKLISVARAYLSALAPVN